MPTQKMDINIHKTQLEIIAEMDNEISDRTLRDTAIPFLVALRYIDVDESDKANIYTIHLAQVQRGIHNPPKTSEVLPALQHLIEDGSTSDKWRKYFLRLLAILPTSIGKSSDSQKRTRVAHKEEQRSPLSKDKNKKSNNDHKKIQVVAIQTDEMQKESVMSSAAAIQPPSEVFLRDVPSEIQPQQEAATRKPQSLDQNAPRTVKTVLQLIEFLRGQRFREPERTQQARAAAILIGIQPALSLKEIQDAWLHGSDEYWKKNHDQAGMTVIDLIHHNSHGKRRIIATLEHKQRQEQEPTSRKSDQDSIVYAEHRHSALVIEPAWSGQIMTEQEAQQVAAQAIQDGQAHHYNLNAYSACEENIWVVKVQLEQHIFTIHNPSEWSQEFTGIHEVLQLRKKLSSTERKDFLWLK